MSTNACCVVSVVVLSLWLVVVWFWSRRVQEMDACNQNAPVTQCGYRVDRPVIHAEPHRKCRPAQALGDVNNHNITTRTPPKGGDRGQQPTAQSGQAAKNTNRQTNTQSRQAMNDSRQYNSGRVQKTQTRNVLHRKICITCHV